MDWKVVGSQVLLLILLSTGASSDDGEKRVVCYYTNWSVYRPGTAKFSPQNINPYLCTHLIYAFGGFSKDNALKPFDKYQDVDKGGYAKFTGLKTYNKNLKTLLAVGGWNEGSNRFSPMVADPQRRRQFVKSAVKFLRQNHFDGLDLDWEYPAFREGGKPRDRDNYASLVQELREEFEKESSKTGRPRLLLTMAVPAGIEYIDKGYDIPKLDEYLDFMNLLSYDYHSAYEPAVNHHSPLYPLEEDNEYNYDNELTIDYTIKHLIKSGASSEKIVVGIPTYGRSYTLFNEDANALGSPADGPGAEGDATREKGYLAYYEICESISKDDWNVEKPNPKAMGPYAYKNNQWVGYDDEDIVRDKARYVNEKNLGGIMFWSIDNDDFRGKCHGRPYPLIEAAKEALLEENGKKKLDERPNAISTKKRNRVSENSKSSSQSNNRKLSDTSNRRNIISRPSTGKRASISSKSRNRSNSKTANEHKSDEESDDNVENNESVDFSKSSQKSTRPRLLTNKNRFRTRLNINERESQRKQVTEATSTQKTLSKKATTPEPPTTPDPGSDFKCEDEGFFPHPRDCKKYFWCLDSGPSGLGIVANQFTCPSGLVFNKLADSCDYPRNVICPKNKPKSVTTTTTTARTTTEKEKIELPEEEEELEEDEEYEDEEEEIKVIEDKNVEEERPKKRTTTAKPLLYKTINRSRPTTSTKLVTTSSTPLSTSISPGLEDDISDEEQDPRVIKELIDLIKKAGGIEHLEKQLAFQEKTTGNLNQGNGQVTPASISKSLYERVLNQKAGKNNLFGLPTSRLVSNRKTDDVEEEEDEEEEEQLEEKPINSKSNSKFKFVNGPGRSQFEGLDEVPEVKSLRRTSKPKYVTIKRHSSTKSTKNDDELNENDDEEEDQEEDNEDVASSEEKLISNISVDKNLSIQKSTPGYVNIRRTRPTSTTESLRADNDIKDVDAVIKDVGPTKRRTSLRPTEVIQKDVSEESTTPKTRYISVNRFRSTTLAPQKEIEQSTVESTSAKAAITAQSLNNENTVKEKTITISGETGRISITPFTTVTSSTASTLPDLASSTVSSTSPFTEEKTTSTHYSTKQVTETTTAHNPNTIEDSATESLLNIVPTETSTRETIAAVSQPRPFGFPRRTRPTVALPTVSDTTYSSLTGIESTSRFKVLDEPVVQHFDSKNITAHKTTSNFMTEIPKKTSILNDSLHNKPENETNTVSLIKQSQLMNPLNEHDKKRIVKVPVKIVDDPSDDFFLLQIPKNKLNISRFSSILKIEVLKNDERNLKDVNSFKKIEDNNILNGSLIKKNLNPPSYYNTEITAQSLFNFDTANLTLNRDNNTSQNDVFLDDNEKKLFLKNNETIKSNFALKTENLNSLNVRKNASASNLNENLTASGFGYLVKNSNSKNNDSAIYNLKNIFINKRPFPNKNSSIDNTELFENLKNSTAKKKVHRQRVLIYRGSTNHQPTNNNSSSQRRWVMKKVVRRKLTPARLNSTDDLETSGTASMADPNGSFVEVNSSRNPGFTLFQQPGDFSLPQGVYTTFISPMTKFYHVQNAIGDTRVLADQNGIPQNLELILAEPPATISSSTTSGGPAITGLSFRRKISTTVSPRTTEETSSSSSSRRVISSDRRRQGQKYDSDRVIVPNSYQIRSRPYKPAVTDYDYYEDEEERFVGKPHGKLLITSRGVIKCLDQGNFPHPSSCSKFITCAKMVNGNVIGTEYTCPQKLSFDPIGGICNWSAGLGCND